MLVYPSIFIHTILQITTSIFTDKVILEMESVQLTNYKTKQTVYIYTIKKGISCTQ